MSGDTDYDNLSGRLTDEGHELQARVYYADTDFFGRGLSRALPGIPWNAAARISCGLSACTTPNLKPGRQARPIYWVVRRMEIDFRAPARIDDVLDRLDAYGGDQRQGAHPHGAGNQARRDAFADRGAIVEAALINADGQAAALSRRNGRNLFANPRDGMKP
jgi:acyl-CoA thioester hydrolase